MPQISALIPNKDNTIAILEFSDELLLEVFYNLLPEELIALKVVNQQVNDLVNDNLLWLFKLKQHFPSVASQDSAIPNAYELFWQTYDKEYQALSTQQRKLFSQAKEGNATLLNLQTAKDLLVCDKRGLTLLHWLAIKKQWVLLNALYENLDLRNALRLPHLQWAIHCYQPLKKIEVLVAAQNFPQDHTLANAAFFGQLEVVRYLCSLTTNNRPNLINVDYILVGAAKTGQLEVINYLCNLIAGKANQRAISAVLMQAAECGQLAIVCYLCNLTGENRPLPWDIRETLEKATKHGQLNIVQYLCGLTGENKPNQLTIGNMLEKATHWGQREIVKYLCNLTDNKPNMNAMSLSLKKAIDDEHWEIVKYLRSIFAINKSRQFLVVDAFEKAAKCGQLAIVSNLWRLDPYDRQLNHCIDCILLRDTMFPPQIINWLRNSRTPVSYTVLSQQFSEPLLKARALLNDYTKGNSAPSRFFYGHWNRSHILEVAEIVQQIDDKKILNKDQLFHALGKIKFTKETDSLPRRIQFIQNVIFFDLAEETIAPRGLLP